MRILLTVMMIFIGSALHAEVKYQQDLTFTSFKSQSDAIARALVFIKATVGDPNIKVIDYAMSQDDISWHVTLTCHVSEQDADFDRILFKISGKGPDLVID